MTIETQLEAYLEKRLGAHKGSFPELVFQCPFCIDRRGDESAHHKLGINVKRGKANCWRCGYGAHKLEKLLRDLNGGRLGMEEQAVLSGEVQLPEKTSVARELLIRFFSGTKITRLKPVELPPRLSRWKETRIVCAAVPGRTCARIEAWGTRQRKWSSVLASVTAMGREANRCDLPHPAVRQSGVSHQPLLQGAFLKESQPPEPGQLLLKRGLHSQLRCDGREEAGGCGGRTVLDDSVRSPRRTHGQGH